MFLEIRARETSLFLSIAFSIDVDGTLGHGPPPMMTEYSIAELAGFRLAQRIAYAATASVEAAVRPGVTERDVATLLHARLAEAGVRRYFHGPLVWFGDRTVLGDAWPGADYLPTSRELRPGMPVILDVAPIVDGYVADVAYSFAFGENFEMEMMLAELAWLRDAIPRALRRGLSLAAAYRRVDAMIERRGYASRHRASPFGALGHRVTRLAPEHHHDVARMRIERDHSRFDPKVWPLWSDRDDCAGPVPHGVWAVEPHLGRDGVGAKFEELLVVDADGVHWLDDDLPHVKRASRRRVPCPPPLAKVTSLPR
jgi:Xaa-Pro aminopeptidase